jgi:protein-S-isoprenylcysteine O-methyltransferase Ste14
MANTEPALVLLAAAPRPFARGVLLATAVIWVMLELRQSAKRRPEGAKANWVSEVVFRLAVVVGALAASVLSRTAPAAAIRPATVADWIGLGLLWCGMALRFWSFRTLGRYFTVVVQTSGDQPVITGGPYRLIRHPSYAGLLLIVTGVGLLIGNWLSLIGLTVTMLCGLVFRIWVEERALLASLGEDYRSYAATHKRLVPFIW